MNDKLYQSRTAGILVSIAAYMLALLIALSTGRMFPSAIPFLTIAYADLAATLTIFILSMAFNNSSMYDPYWSVKPAVIAAFFMVYHAGEGAGIRQLLVFALVILYAIRLTSNFYRDWPGLKHEDWRYVNFRRQFPRAYWLVSFIGIHFFPTVMVYLGCLALAGALDPAGSPMNLVDLAAFVVTFGAIILAFTADEQLRNFRKDPANKGKYISSGLWKFSRHPNYLGEILTWWGLYLFALASGLAWWWTGIGAMAITLMFVFVSIPMMDKKNLDNRPGYRDYSRSIPALLPFRF